MKAKKGMYDKVEVFAAKVKISNVPFQGELLGERFEQPEIYKKLENGHIKPKIVGAIKGVKDAFIDLFDTVLGVIPIIGDIYDIAQFGYAAATGEDFWGREVSEVELAVLGGAILLPFGLKKRS